MTKTFKEFLAEAASQEECQQKFEKLLFGTFLKGGEPDTDHEQKVFDFLTRFIEYNELDGPGVKFLQDLKDCEQYYADMLKVPTGLRVYRKTRLPDAQLQDEDWKPSRRKGYMEAMTSYAPHRKVTSWTTKFDIAKNFTPGRDPDYTDVDVILETKTDNTFLLNTKLTNAISKYVAGFIEHEVMKVGNGWMDCRVYITEDDYHEIMGEWE